VTRCQVIALILPLALAAGGQPQDDPFAKWEKAIAAFEEQDKKAPPPQKEILFVGSSSIRLWDLSKSFPGVKTINRGFGGSQIADAIHFAPRIVLKHKPRVVVFYAGDNDLAAGKKPDQVFADFKKFAEVVHKELPATKLVFIAIKPSPSRWKLYDQQQKANALVEAFARDDKRVVYLDVVKPMLDRDGKPKGELFKDDKLHLNEEGYRLWTSLLRPHLQ
jgi:lysophospholipase L1-like esterase